MTWISCSSQNRVRTKTIFLVWSWPPPFFALKWVDHPYILAFTASALRGRLAVSSHSVPECPPGKMLYTTRLGSTMLAHSVASLVRNSRLWILHKGDSYYWRGNRLNFIKITIKWEAASPQLPVKYPQYPAILCGQIESLHMTYTNSKKWYQQYCKSADEVETL